jgi:8-oxo-dGTP diphosphatase
MKFEGAKVALFYQDKIVVCLRDDKPGLKFSGMWDFPGGGREANETPEQCAIREITEEFGIELSSDQFTWTMPYPSMSTEGLQGYFLVAHLSKDQFDHIKFGDEGQKWQLMTPDEYINHELAIHRLAENLQIYLRDQGSAR